MLRSQRCSGGGDTGAGWGECAEETGTLLGVAGVVGDTTMLSWAGQFLGNGTGRTLATLARIVGTIFTICLRHAFIVTLVEGDACAGNPLSISDSVVQKRKAWLQPGMGAHA